jgi:hypothetical protein
MQTTNLIKLAPTLSAEEKFKIIVADFHKEIDGEKPILSDSERRAIIKCENRAMWEDYTRHIGIMQWADVFWTKDIETEKLRVFACFLFLSREVDRFVAEIDMPMPEKMRDDQFTGIRENVEMFEKSSIRFYAYREAIAQIERGIYGMPLFNERKKRVIAEQYDAVDELFEHYNRRVTMLADCEILRDRMKPVVEDIERYSAKKPVPEKELIDNLVDGIMQIVDAEIAMLGR